MNSVITQETFDGLVAIRADPAQTLDWAPLFVLPEWLAVWWWEFGGDAELYLAAVRQGDAVIGVAPLKIRGEEASLVGDTDVCDYLDFVVAPGRAGDFFTVLLDNLASRGLKRLVLEPLRPDSVAFTCLSDIAANRGDKVSCQPAAVSVEMALPATWEEYLGGLAAKQRHEVKRKLKKLYAAGVVTYRYTGGGSDTGALMDDFFRLFALSPSDKVAFMTTRMERFFRGLAAAMDKAGLLRFGVLELDGKTVAMVMAFDYRGSVYLYNSAYDPAYQDVSVGLLSKVLCIQESIKLGRRCFDFLKGNESYKYNIGGQGVDLYSCRLDIG